MLGSSFQISSDELKEIFARLQPYLPKGLTKVDTSSRWLQFEFEPFTGREEEPCEPATYTDPKLRYVSESEDGAEHRLREKARTVLSQVYEQARQEWRNAAYVADLKGVVRDAPVLWKTYQHEVKALGTAYDYLRAPEAAQEWAPAVSRLVDAQDRTKAAAHAFDQRAEEIAEVHDKHLYADLGHNAALTAAGYPEAKDWVIASAHRYRQNYYGDYETYVPLEEQVRRLIEQQDAHVTKVGRLSGTAA